MQEVYMVISSRSMRIAIGLFLACILIAGCASRSKTLDEEIKLFGGGGLWIRDGLFNNWQYQRLKDLCTSSGGTAVGYDQNGFEEASPQRIVGPDQRRPTLLVCSSAGEVRWGVSFKWFDERLATPFLSDKREPAISSTATLLTAPETDALRKSFAGWQERKWREDNQISNERAKERGRAALAAMEAEDRRRARIRQDSPAFRERVKEGDSCNITAPIIGFVPCLVILVKKPLVQVQVGSQTNWIRIDELMAP